MTLPIVLVAAVARNGGIGLRNRLPWRLPSDLARFRALTMGKPVIIGRKTALSIGGPLPGRHLVVVSSDPHFAPPAGVRARNPLAALDAAEAIGRECGADEIIVAGGGALYAALIGRAARLDITDVDAAPEADAHFPTIDPMLWRETRREPGSPGPDDEAGFTFVTYRRR